VKPKKVIVHLNDTMGVTEQIDLARAFAGEPLAEADKWPAGYWLSRWWQQGEQYASATLTKRKSGTWVFKVFDEREKNKEVTE